MSNEYPTCRGCDRAFVPDGEGQRYCGECGAAEAAESEAGVHPVFQDILDTFARVGASRYRETRGGVLTGPADGLNEVCGHCGCRFAGSLGFGPACRCKPKDWPGGKRPRWEGSRHDHSREVK